MQSETAHLAETVRRLPAFQVRAIEAVHGDLKEGNVFVTANDWFVLDRDDLSLGDPAIDLAVLLWPMVWAGGDWRNYNTSPIGDALAERLEVCFRAQLLDEIIDSLADYVEAHTVPSRQAEVERVKRQRHEEALEQYRRLAYLARSLR